MTFDVEFIIDTLTLSVIGNILYAILHTVYVKIANCLRKNNRHE